MEVVPQDKWGAEKDKKVDEESTGAGNTKLFVDSVKEIDKFFGQGEFKGSVPEAEQYGEWRDSFRDIEVGNAQEL